MILCTAWNCTTVSCPFHPGREPAERPETDNGLALPIAWEAYWMTCNDYNVRDEG